MRIFSISSSSKSARVWSPKSNCPVFHSILTQEDTDDIECIQNIVLGVILDERYTDYDSSCKLLNVETLQSRRTNLCLNFAIKSFRSNKFNIFKDDIKTFSHNLRTFVCLFVYVVGWDPQQQMFHLPFAANSRYYNSPRLYLCRLLQEHLSKTENKLGSIAMQLMMNYRYVLCLIIKKKNDTN